MKQTEKQTPEQMTELAARLSLDGGVIDSRAALYDEITRQLPLPAYCGRNLDALWDVLSVRRAPLAITVTNSAMLQIRLGDYGQALLNLLRDLARENAAITVSID